MKIVDSVTGNENTVFQCQEIRVLLPKYYIYFSLTNVGLELCPLFFFYLVPLYSALGFGLLSARSFAEA